MPPTCRLEIVRSNAIHFLNHFAIVSTPSRATHALPDRPATVLGFDPGRDKCGIAVVRLEPTPPNSATAAETLQQHLQRHEVVASDRALDRLEQLQQQFGATVLAIGDRTTSRSWQQQIRQRLPQLAIAPVNERNSTLEARDRYWQMYPPRGLSRIIPQGLRVPPRPIDDIVAVLLVERYVHRDRSLLET